LVSIEVNKEGPAIFIRAAALVRFAEAMELNKLIVGSIRRSSGSEK